MLDVNAGIPLADEPGMLAKAIQLVPVRDRRAHCPSTPPSSLRWKRGLAVYKGKALVNSVTGEEDRLETVLPLVKKYGAAVVAISNDETGISQDPDVRFAVAKKIVERAADYGIPACDIVVDPLVHAHWRHQPGRRAGHAAGTPPAHRAQGQHHLWRIQRELWPARAQWHQLGVSDHGDCCGHDLGHHQPAARREWSKPSWAPT